MDKFLDPWFRIQRRTRPNLDEKGEESPKFKWDHGAQLGQTLLCTLVEFRSSVCGFVNKKPVGARDGAPVDLPVSQDPQISDAYTHTYNIRHPTICNNNQL